MFSRILERVDRQSRLFGEMRERIGSNDGGVMSMSDEVNLRNGIWVCLSCSSSTECQNWLSTKNDWMSAKKFCPNFELFRQLHGKRDVLDT